MVRHLEQFQLFRFHGRVWLGATTTSRRLFQWDPLAFFVSHKKASSFGVGRIKKMIRNYSAQYQHMSGVQTLYKWTAAVWITIAKKD